MTGDLLAVALLVIELLRSFSFVSDHSKGSKDGIRGSSQGDDSFRTIPLRDVAPLYLGFFLNDSPFFLMIPPTSFPCISSQMVRMMFNPPSITLVSLRSSVLGSWT